MSTPPSWLPAPERPASDGPVHAETEQEPLRPFAAPAPYPAPSFGSSSFGSAPFGDPRFGTPLYSPPQFGESQHGGQQFGVPPFESHVAADPYGAPAAGAALDHPPYGHGPTYAPTTNGLALSSLVTSLVSLLIIVAAPVGLILGLVALRQIGRDGTQGRGQAIAGIVVGAVMTLVLVGTTIVVIASVFLPVLGSGGFST